MKICFVYNSIFTLGGIQRCLTNLSNYLVRNGYDVIDFGNVSDESQISVKDNGIL